VPEDPYVISVDRFLPYPPEQLFAVVADPERHPELDGSGTVRSVQASRVPLEVGSTFDMHMVRGFPYATRSTVTELDPGRRITWSTRPLTFPLSLLIGGRTWSYTFEPEGAGTKVTETWDLRPEKNRRLVRPLAGDPASDMRATLERLGELAGRE
jgi:uncharacterized protein YndB with AHSA1/START domain